MSHELEVVNGKAMMAYAGKVPWHGLGTKVPDDLTPDQMLQAAGLDWKVETIPAFAEIDGKTVGIGRSALVRSSDKKILDVITDDWNPCQNDVAFEFFTDFIAAGDMSMHTAGSLKDGRIVWVLAKVNESFELLGGRDTIESFLLFSNPHQYGQSIDVRLTPTRVVCNNTYSMAMNSASRNMVKVSHRNEFDPDFVKQTLGVASTELKKYHEAATFLTKSRFTDENVVEYFKRVFPVLTQKEDSKKTLSKNAALCHTVLNTQPGAELGEGTWWAAFNAVTFATNHLLGRSADNRLHSAWYGSNKNVNQHALELAVEYAGK